MIVKGSDAGTHVSRSGETSDGKTELQLITEFVYVKNDI
jgi:hypothetical protein